MPEAGVQSYAGQSWARAAVYVRKVKEEKEHRSTPQPRKVLLNSKVSKTHAERQTLQMDSRN